MFCVSMLCVCLEGGGGKGGGGGLGMSFLSNYVGTEL